MSIFRGYFFKNYFVRKIWRGGDESLLKMVQQMVALTKHVIPGPDLHCTGSLARKGFLQHLPAKFK